MKNYSLSIISFESRRQDAYLCKSKLYSHVEVVGNISINDPLVFAKRDTMERLKSVAKASHNVEIGGFLIGCLRNNEDGDRYIIEVSDLIIGEHTVSSPCSVCFTSNTLKTTFDLMRTEFSNKRLMGWYHSHIMEETPLYISSTDVILHKSHFSEPWNIGLVLDRYGGCKFFQNRNGEVVSCGGYHLFDDGK